MIEGAMLAALGPALVPSTLGPWVRTMVDTVYAVQILTVEMRRFLAREAIRKFYVAHPRCRAALGAAKRIEPASRGPRSLLRRVGTGVTTRTLRCVVVTDRFRYLDPAFEAIVQRRIGDLWDRGVAREIRHR